VTRVLVGRYITPFTEQGETGEAILQTVERYLANQGSPGRTADELFVHTNTVRYRLSRFEAVTGCSLRDAQSMVEVWWALEGRRLDRP
jgi:DNA-binding PucR family transcriptional regulator